MHLRRGAQKESPEGTSEYLTCSFIRDTGGAVAAGACFSMKPAEPSSLLAVEELMRQGGDCIFHLGLTVKAGISLAWTVLPLFAVMWTTAPTLGSLRRAVMWANGVKVVLLKRFESLSSTTTYSPALCTYCKRASHERKPE